MMKFNRRFSRLSGNLPKSLSFVSVHLTRSGSWSRTSLSMSPIQNAMVYQMATSRSQWHIVSFKKTSKSSSCSACVRPMISLSNSSRRPSALDRLDGLRTQIWGQGHSNPAKTPRSVDLLRENNKPTALNWIAGLTLALFSMRWFSFFGFRFILLMRSARRLDCFVLSRGTVELLMPRWCLQTKQTMWKLSDEQNQPGFGVRRRDTRQETRAFLDTACAYDRDSLREWVYCLWIWGQVW